MKSLFAALAVLALVTGTVVLAGPANATNANYTHEPYEGANN